MNLFIKQLTIIILLISAILSIVYGSYLPFVKSQNFITALTLLSSMKTIDEFKTNFDRAFKFYSPIGDEEIAKFLSKDIFQIINQSDQPENVSRLLISYIEPYMFKNDVRHLLSIGQTYQVLWMKYGQQEKDFQKAENYFLKAYQIGPNLPPILYGLFDLYRMKKDDQKIKEFGEIILKNWPDDEQVRGIVDSL